MMVFMEKLGGTEETRDGKKKILLQSLYNPLLKYLQEISDESGILKQFNIISCINRNRHDNMK